MSHYERQSSHSSYDMMPDADFPDDYYQKNRSPQHNEDNMSSNQIGYGSATSFDEDLYIAARVLAPAPVSNEDSTETAGTNDTLPANGAAGQVPEDVLTSSNALTLQTSSQTITNAHTSNPDTLALTLHNMELHHQGTYSHTVEHWVGTAGTRRLIQLQAPMRGYSSSVVSTRSGGSNTSRDWYHVFEHVPVDDHVCGMTDWADEVLRGAYGASRPAGH